MSGCELSSCVMYGFSDDDDALTREERAEAFVGVSYLAETFGEKMDVGIMVVTGLGNILVFEPRYWKYR